MGTAGQAKEVEASGPEEPTQGMNEKVGGIFAASPKDEKDRASGPRLRDARLEP